MTRPESQKPRNFGGAQPGAGRPPKDGVRINRLLATEVHALLEPLKAKTGLKTDTAVIEEALRRMAQQELPAADEGLELHEESAPASE